MIEMKKNETPWSVDIYLHGVKNLKKKLEKHKIYTRVVYPPLNTQKIYSKFKNFPISNFYCNNGLWLPSSLDLKNSEIDKICKLVNRYAG